MTGWILAVLALYFVQTLAAPMVQWLQGGLKFIPDAMGPRDTAPQMPKIGSRFDRALRNMFEALVIFLPVAVLLEVKGITGGGALMGAAIFFWARVAYVPAYVSGIPGLRSAVWVAGHAGLLMMIAALWNGAPLN